MSEVPRTRAVQEITGGPVPLGWGEAQVPRESWNWLAALRAEKIGPHVTYAETVLDFSRDAGWNIARLNCKRKVTFSPVAWADQREGDWQAVSQLGEVAGAVDLVLTHHTLGLLRDPHKALVELKPVLRKGGRLLVFVPLETERSLSALRSEKSSPWFYTWNVQTLGNLLGEAGFEFIEGGVRPFGSEVFALRQVERFGGGERAFERWRKFGWFFEACREVWVLARPFAD